jgi:prophage regulatory protein
MNYSGISFGNSQLLRAAELSSVLGISQTTLWRWRKNGTIPHPISLGPRMVGWRRKDIDEWLNQLSDEGGVQ